MRNAVKVIIFLCVLISMPVNVHALSDKDFALTDDPFNAAAKLTLSSQDEREAVKKEEEPQVSEVPEAEEPKEPAPVQHTVAVGENLTKIAEHYATTWNRLFDKNTQLADPNLLKIGDVITIPDSNEELTERPLPATAPVDSHPVSTSRHPARAAGSSAGSSAGNTYTRGYCTWYAKNRRPDLPNRLGNASSWVASAAARGFATGSAPRVGAIGQQGNHVVYIESVNNDGTVTVSEMNYQGINIISSRTVPAGTFYYIY